MNKFVVANMILYNLASVIALCTQKLSLFESALLIAVQCGFNAVIMNLKIEE